MFWNRKWHLSVKYLGYGCGARILEVNHEGILCFHCGSVETIDNTEWQWYEPVYCFLEDSPKFKRIIAVHIKDTFTGIIDF